jgi:Rrf2 family protein
MIKINRRVEYALMVLKLMHERETQELTTAREVCEKFKTPFDTTAKVMQQLNISGVLTSVKGVKGGYFLQRDLATLSYKELAEMIEGKSFALDCHEGPCELMGTCNISAPIKRLNDYLIAIFSSLSVLELLTDNTLPTQMKLSCPSFKEHA